MFVHLLLELYGCDRVCMRAEGVRHLLDTFPPYLGWGGAGPVQISHIDACNPCDAKLTGFVDLALAHISLCAWPHYGEAVVDLCSCEDFSQADAIAFVVAMLRTEDIEAHFVLRGTRSRRAVTPGQARYAAESASRRGGVRV